MKLFAAFALFISTLPAQQLAFEVASIKPSNLGGGVRGSCHGIDSKYTPMQLATAPPLGRCVIFDARLSHLINIAYNTGTMDMIRGGPDWIARGDDRYNIEAKAEDPSKITEEQLLQMLQALLVERFQMKFHRETIETPGFAMLVAKNGSKVQPSASADTRADFGGPSKGKPVPGQPTELRLRKYSMAAFTQLLSAFGDNGPIVDETALTGDYDIQLRFGGEDGPTLATALQEQLGLRLERRKVQRSLFIVDSAQKPGAN